MTVLYLMIDVNARLLQQVEHEVDTPTRCARRVQTCLREDVLLQSSAHVKYGRAHPRETVRSGYVQQAFDDFQLARIARDMQRSIAVHVRLNIVNHATLERRTNMMCKTRLWRCGRLIDIVAFVTFSIGDLGVDQ